MDVAAKRLRDGAKVSHQDLPFFAAGTYCETMST